MTPRTQETLNELSGREWFYAVGEPGITKALTVHSWMEAVAYGASWEWTVFRRKAVAGYKGNLYDLNEQRHSEWTVVKKELTPIVTKLARSQTRAVVEREKLPRQVVESAALDILNLALECEFWDIVGPGFFTGISYYYAHGHFPCGWKGEHPEGQLIVY